MIKYSNHLLLTQNSLLSTCCCVDNSVYWEAVPCDMTRKLRDGICTEYDTCQFENRIFVKENTRCAGDGNLICECQRISFDNFTSMSTANTKVDNLISIVFSGVAGAQLILTDDSLTLTQTGFDDFVVDFATTTTISSLITAVNAAHGGSWAFTISDSNFNTYSPKILVNITLTFNNIAPQYLDSRLAGLYLLYNDILVYVVPDSTPSIFATNIQTALRTINADFSVVHNSILSDGDVQVFEVVFGGSLCGIYQTKITTFINFLCITGTTNVVDVWAYGSDGSTFGNNFGDPGYYVVGTFDDCPYEKSTGENPLAFNSGIQCCPQKGVVQGPNQLVGFDSTGYIKYHNVSENPWLNLENTVVINDECYSIAPYYFIFGMGGRIRYNYFYNKKLHVKPDSSGCNCVKELFLPMFSKNIPWGPFGSYYKDIEADLHLAWTEPYNTNFNPNGSGSSYLSVTYEVPRIGYDYRPTAWMKFKGEWTETKQIEIYAAVKKPLPFYVGTDEYDDINQYIEIKPDSISSDLIVSYTGPTGCASFTATFNCSGKTVGDFIEAINALEIKDATGCKIFSFCISDSGVLGLPASTIINVSSDIFETNTDASSFNDKGDPYQDTNKLSACTIPLPKPYGFYHHGSEELTQWADYNGVLPNVTDYYHPIYNSTSIRPPSCRLNTNPLRSGIATAATKSQNMWITNIQGCNTDVLNIKLSTGSFVPTFTQASVYSSGREIFLYASGAVAISGRVNTNRNGSGYTVEDCVSEINALSYLNGLDTYYPFIAQTGVGERTWLDDSTSINGINYYYDSSNPTTYNFSYREKLLDSSPQNMSATRAANLQTFHRRRCDGTTVVDLPPCIPTYSTLINEGYLNCSDDRVFSGNWLISYGCASYVCKTRWFLKASRCDCETVSRCNGTGPEEQPHPFNQLAKGANTKTWGNNGYSVTQPTLYICEYNFHPECDIPVMIKVPFQIINDDGSLLYQNGNRTSLPGFCEFCNNSTELCDGGAYYSNAFGWCQTLDPLGIKVKEQDIPRTDPPTAYIAARAGKPFCSVNPWNYNPKTSQVGAIPSAIGPDIFAGFNLPDGCVGPLDDNYAEACAGTCASCEGWDRICNLGIVFPNGIEYHPLTDEAILCALFRPILDNVTEDEICPSGSSCRRLDINCATACCECYFTCAAGDSCENTLVKYPYTQSVSISYSENSTNPLACDLLDTFGPGCDIANGSFGYCNGDPDVGRCYQPQCFSNGTYSTTFNIDFNYNVTNCGCDAPQDETFTGTVTMNPDCGFSLTCGGAGCVTAENPASIEPFIYILNCNSDLTNYANCGTCEGSGSYTQIVDHTINYDDCGTRPSWNIYQQNSGVISCDSTNSPSDPCGNVGYTCSNTYNLAINSKTYNGSAECRSPSSVDISLDITRYYSVSDRTFGACNFTTPFTAKTFDYINNWRINNTGFYCGYGNLSVFASGVDGCS